MKRLFTLIFITFMIFSNMAFAAKAIKEPVVTQEMTIDQLAAANEISAEKLLKDLKIADTSQNRALNLTALSVNEETAKQVIRKQIVLNTEEKSKDWKKIRIKFALWGMTVILGIFLLSRYRVTPRFRTWQVFFSFMIFGILLGSDPSPMGTIKDTVALLGLEGTFFPPRVAAFVVFTMMVILGNKIICGWGCQFGALQDWLYQVSPVRAKIRFPFSVTNSIRIIFFLLFVVAAFIISFDLIGAIDPFKVFEPSHLTYLSGGFIAAVLFGSLFVYRPWCTLACPFGLTSWFFERFSWFRIRLNEEKCIHCGTCQSVCPTEHTRGLLSEVKYPGDCYSCGACLGQCPTHALRYSKK